MGWGGGGGGWGGGGGGEGGGWCGRGGAGASQRCSGMSESTVAVRDRSNVPTIGSSFSPPRSAGSFHTEGKRNVNNRASPLWNSRASEMDQVGNDSSSPPTPPPLEIAFSLRDGKVIERCSSLIVY